MTNTLPDFSAPVLPKITGKFRREELPKNYRRPLRVGLSNDKHVVHIDCGEFCRVDFEGNGAGRVPGNLTAEIMHDHLVLTSSDGHHFKSEKNVVRIEPWDAGKFVSLEGKPYRGIFEVAQVGHVVRVVNIVAMEDYLRGVVPNEIGHLDTTMFEALKAQAVAARTYAYKHFLSRQSQGFDIYADIRDQVYDGQGAESALANQQIEGSSGVVMQWNNSLIEAYYHSTCGGHTESVETWSRTPVPYLKAVPDVDAMGNPLCALSSYANWEIHYSWDELSRIAKQYLNTSQADPILDFHHISKVVVLNHLPGGRVNNVQFTTDRGTFMVKGDKNRWIFRNPQNPDKTLPSAWFDVSSDDNGITLKGRGFGHGIGMCQFGARTLAKDGFGYKDILWHYYPDVDLVKWVEPSE